MNGPKNDYSSIYFTLSVISYDVIQHKREKQAMKFHSFTGWVSNILYKLIILIHFKVPNFNIKLKNYMFLKSYKRCLRKSLRDLNFLLIENVFTSELNKWCHLTKQDTWWLISKSSVGVSENLWFLFNFFSTIF